MKNSALQQVKLRNRNNSNVPNIQSKDNSNKMIVIDGCIVRNVYQVYQVLSLNDITCRLIKRVVPVPSKVASGIETHGTIVGAFHRKGKK